MSNKISKQGKAPLSSKGKNVSEFFLGTNASDFDVPENCSNELKAKGLIGRWVDINQLRKSGNRHRQGWVPYKFDCLKAGVNDAFADKALDGFLCSQGMVLATKTEEMAHRQRETNRRRSLLQSNAGKSVVETFKEAYKGDKDFKISGSYEEEAE